MGGVPGDVHAFDPAAGDGLVVSGGAQRHTALQPQHSPAPHAGEQRQTAGRELHAVHHARAGNPRNPVTRQKHTWKAVRIDGAGHPLDTGWGAGYIMGERFVRRVRDFYFLHRSDR